MRFAAYAGVRMMDTLYTPHDATSMLTPALKTSVVLATGTVLRAFYERANFYSASVAIAQSNASLMVSLR